jgi:cytochrome c oxidase accessory protein FixG
MRKDEAVYVIGDEQDLYQKQEKIIPKAVSGLFNNFRVGSVWLLLGLYYCAPWFTWNGRQAILLDLPARQFHLFGLTFWPQDFIFLTLLLIVAALALFFFTSVAGRLWCGYACPQTVWTQLFVWVERFIEGSRNNQLKLNKAPWSFNKFKLKLTKHFLWIILALFTGYTFVGYFIPIKVLTYQISSGSIGGWGAFWILFYSFATWGNAGKLREQVCIYMCPYARFQSAMFDKDTLIISYDTNRGESRGRRKKDNQDYRLKGLGDCIDCMLCVQVCPTGIDIRDGLQYECIACAACIDACDQVMEKMNYPKGLIRYSTERQEKLDIEHKDRNSLQVITKKHKPKSGLSLLKANILRPKTLGYGVILVALVMLFFIAIATRNTVELDIVQDRTRLYVTNSKGLIENIYQLKILNKSQQNEEFSVSVEGLVDYNYKGSQEVSLNAGEVSIHPIRISLDPFFLVSSNLQFSISLRNVQTGEKVTKRARFLSPRKTKKRVNK